MKSSSPADHEPQRALQPRTPQLERFDYSSLRPEVAQKVQAAAGRIRQLVKRSLLSTLESGQELREAKLALGPGNFGPWLREEFGWTERTAQYFMCVAERFQGEAEIISDLHIAPTAAYLLAAPSAPEEAYKVAIIRAKNGDKITASVAREILAAARNQPARPEKRQRCPLADAKLRGKLLEVFEPLRQSVSSRQMPMLARHLRDLADSLEKG